MVESPPLLRESTTPFPPLGMNLILRSTTFRPWPRRLGGSEEGGGADRLYYLKEMGNLSALKQGRRKDRFPTVSCPNTLQRPVRAPTPLRLPRMEKRVLTRQLILRRTAEECRRWALLIRSFKWVLFLPPTMLDPGGAVPVEILPS